MFSIDSQNIPVSLYVHFPWCVRKCPYCDFNSHKASAEIPFDKYIDALIEDFEQSFSALNNRSLVSIFMGGGTPSLFSGSHIERLLTAIDKVTPLPNEITLEANPGTIECSDFEEYRNAGLTRISLGVQSFHDEHLNKIGRIHQASHVHKAIDQLKKSFTNFNIDLMYGLPNQTVSQALEDIQQALSYDPTHLSWYQLTLEPNTPFYHQKPPLPNEDNLFEMFEQGSQALRQGGLPPYEISAYSKQNPCRHNLNYWEFGDYLGIGAGAHSKISNTAGIQRSTRFRHPKDYLNPDKEYIKSHACLLTQDLSFEFMLNALRLTQGFDQELFSKRTGLDFASITPTIYQAQEKGLILWHDGKLKPSRLGSLYLNDLMGLFLPNGHSSSIPNQALNLS